MTAPSWLITFSALCVLSIVGALVSWHFEEIRLALEFGIAALAAFGALVAAINEATRGEADPISFDHQVQDKRHCRSGMPIYGCMAGNAIKYGHERDSLGVCRLCGDGPGSPS